MPPSSELPSASSARSRGRRLVQAQRLLGHGTPEQTAQVYTHLGMEDLRGGSGAAAADSEAEDEAVDVTTCALPEGNNMLVSPRTWQLSSDMIMVLQDGSGLSSVRRERTTAESS